VFSDGASVVVTRPPNRRDLQKAATRERIFATAMKLFVERGFDPVSVAQIAEASGVSVPTFYAHYPSKESLLMALPSQEEVDLLLAEQPPERPVAEQVREGMRAWLDSCEAPGVREHTLMRWRIIAASPALRLKTAEFERATATMALRALGPGRSGIDELAVHTLCTAYTQILLRWVDADGARPLAEVTDDVFAELDRL
jgi:AcrR family transcriptional regulator